MQFNERRSMTIGVLSHNNSENIIYLLRSILKQKGESFSIDEIIVISDGSTDNTAEKVHKYSEKYPLVRLFADTKQKGKLVRLQQIFSLTKSKYTFIFDGDVILYKNDVLDTMVKSLNMLNIGLVSADLLSIEVKGLKANIIKVWFNLLNQMRKGVNGGDNVYNFREGAFGINTDLAKNIVFPKAVTSASPYLFFTTKAHDLKFQFVSQAQVLFHTPTSFSRYLEQSKIAAIEKKKLYSIFGQDIYKEYRVSLQSKLTAVFISVMRNPFNVLIIMLFSILKIVPYKLSITKKDSHWTVMPTTKRKAHSY